MNLKFLMKLPDKKTNFFYSKVYYLNQIINKRAELLQKK